MENSRFKFRVWSNGKMYQQALVGEPTNTAIVMQCTGLRDKNDKLIYESDIVEFDCGNDIIIGYIQWLENDACFSIRHQKGTHGNFVFKKKIIQICDKFEIIGNKFENPTFYRKNE